MKARSIRFRNRTIVVGRTAFVFDNQGICAHEPKGNSIADFNALMKYPGVEQVEAPRDPEDDPTVPLAIVPPMEAHRPAAVETPPPAPPPPVEEPAPPEEEEEDVPPPPPAPPIEDVLKEIQAETGLKITQVDLPAVEDEEPKEEAASELPAPVSNPKGRRRRSSKPQEG